MNKSYVRDKRSPIPKDENVSKMMSSNKSKGTKPELILRKALFNEGIRGYRLNYKKAPGRPDIAFVAKKIAIFVNGCFWHRCPHCELHLPKHNSAFWQKKFATNIERDKNKTTELQSSGWRVTTIWECEIREELNNIIKVIYTLLQRTGENEQTDSN